MGCYLSSSCFRKAPLSEVIALCGANGVRDIELSAPHPHQTVAEIAGLLRGFRAEGYRFTLHNYFPPPERSFVLNLAAEDAETREASRQLIEGALTLAESAGSPVYGVHAGYLAKAYAGPDGHFVFEDNDGGYAAALKRAVAFVQSINPLFERQKVAFLLENLFPAEKRRHSLFCTFEEIEELLSQVPDSVGLLLDLGHLNISATLLGFDRLAFIDRYLARFGHRLHEVHISENGGRKDEHLPLRPDSWQLDALRTISAVPSRGPAPRVYCLEARNATLDEMKQSLRAIDAAIAV